MNREQNRQQKRWGKIAIVCLVLLFPVLVFMGIKHLINDGKKSPQRKVAMIQLVRPPPPPPPPKPEEKPPEPEIAKQEIKIDDPTPKDAPPEAKADEPAPSQNLGVDAEGTAGTDGFGLVGNKGGASLVGSKNSGSKYGHFNYQVQQQIQDLLARDKNLEHANYRVQVRLWLATDGLIQKAELIGTTGNEQVDKALRLALAELRRLKEAPPADMPQPLGLRISSRS